MSDAPQESRRSRGRRFCRRLVVAAGIYLGWLLVLLALEDRMLYAGATFGKPWVEPPEYLHVREVTLTSGSGDAIHCWFTAPKDWVPERGAILYSHGSGSNLSRISGRAYRWREPLGRAMLLYDYPGYGKSSGRPSEDGCYAAGEAAFEWLVEENKVPPGEILLVGESLGCAVSTELATRHDARLLVLQGGFASFPDMAQIRFPVFPSRWLVHNKMDNEAKVGRARCPVFVSHGTDDAVVPFGQGERVFNAAAEPKRFWRVEGGKHAPPSNPEFFAAVNDFLRETRP
jgi:fermentation-respiration switch protein FrsA (DUF1100 family)